MSHQHNHDKRRHEKLERERLREEEWEKQPRRIHPAWLMVLGAALIFIIVLTWTLL